jgi:hypothetical protein
MAVFAAAYAVMVGLVAAEIRPTPTDTTRTECLFATNLCNGVSAADSNGGISYHDLSEPKLRPVHRVSCCYNSR